MSTKDKNKLKEPNEKLSKSAKVKDESKSKKNDLLKKIEVINKDKSDLNRIKVSKKERIKKHKEKTNIKLGFREFPVKMIKEINKIKWSPKNDNWIKFLLVILFLFLFGIMFFFVDKGIEYLFTVSKII